MPVTTAFRPSSRPLQFRVLPEWLLVVCVAVVPLFIGVMSRDDEHIAHITLSNPTGYQVEISASTPSDPTRSSIGILGAGITRDVLDVVDRGEEWILHIHVDNVEAQPIEVTRSQLTSGTFALPATLADEFVALGAQPPGP